MNSSLFYQHPPEKLFFLVLLEHLNPHCSQIKWSNTIRAIYNVCIMNLWEQDCVESWMLPVKKKDVVLLFMVNWSRRIAVFVSGRRSLGEKSITTVCNVWSTCIHWSNTAASQAETSPIYSIKYSVGCLFFSGWSGYYRIIWIIWWSWKTGSKVHLPNVTKNVHNSYKCEIKWPMLDIVEKNRTPEGSGTLIQWLKVWKHILKHNI